MGTLPGNFKDHSSNSGSTKGIVIPIGQARPISGTIWTKFLNRWTALITWFFRMIKTMAKWEGRICKAHSQTLMERSSAINPRWQITTSLLVHSKTIRLTWNVQMVISKLLDSDDRTVLTLISFNRFWIPVGKMRQSLRKTRKSRRSRKWTNPGYFLKRQSNKRTFK